MSPPPEFDELPMRIGLGQFMHPTEERLRFIKQLGVDDILLNMYRTPLIDTDYEELPLSGSEEWSFGELVQLRNRVEDAGLRLNAIENLPYEFYDEVMLGGDGRDEQLEHIKETIRNMGKAGIPILGYAWMPNGVQRTSTRDVRAGAEGTHFDIDEVSDDLTHGREYTEEEMWDNYEYFLEEVLPVAEEAGVTLALHPDDPPVESLGGIPRLFRSFENFERAMDLVPSDNHGLEFCLGCWSEMGESLDEVIRYFGERDELVYVHFRDVEGTVPKFTETFVDQGNYDEFEILRSLASVGFDGLIIPDHTPQMTDDTDWGHRARGYTVGYLKGMLRCL
jgi:mannonate dehydratase